MSWTPMSESDSPVRFQKYTALGDSITQASGYTAYQTNVAAALGIPTVVNKGQTATTIANINAFAMVFRYTSISTDSDLITVFGGTNDWGNSVPLGTPSDSVDTTFYGALNILCAGLIDAHPDATIAFFTPLQRQTQGSANANGVMLTSYVDAILEICPKFSIPVLDLYRKGGIYALNTKVTAAYMPDGLHPNNAGHQLIANKVAGFIKTL